ncbi:MAG: hypothetical protein JRG76_18495 [Deltaproteobacteria bacterium]|nr:hypothetical protein [Deltaproteobacteria bacterium]
MKMESAQVIRTLERTAIPLGLLLLFVFTDHHAYGDGAVRAKQLTGLLANGEIPTSKYSMIGPLVSAPLWLAGRWFSAARSWLVHFNVVLFSLALLLLWTLLRDLVAEEIRRRFLLILIFGSMFGMHQTDYHGEVFTALFVAVGVAALVTGRNVLGATALVLGVANTPATMVGLGFVAAMLCWERRQLRYLALPVAAIAVYGLESWLFRGSLLASGYENAQGYATALPYSGRPGFSYPLFFGIVSILFSFGKGLVLYAPGLLLPVRDRLAREDGRALVMYRLWLAFLIGMILVYAKWFAWYGGDFWGPRFFLFASVPASFALAVRLAEEASSVRQGVVTLAVLGFAFWVGLSGVVFGQRGLELCRADNYALESFCWYVPEFSALFHPFVDRLSIDAQGSVMLVGTALVLALLGVPLLRRLARNAARELRSWRRRKSLRGPFRV